MVALLCSALKVAPRKTTLVHYWYYIYKIYQCTNMILVNPINHITNSIMLLPYNIVTTYFKASLQHTYNIF
jgi:hypothetical protein